MLRSFLLRELFSEFLVGKDLECFQNLQVIFFSSLSVVGYIYRFTDTEHPSTPGLNPTCMQPFSTPSWLWLAAVSPEAPSSDGLGEFSLLAGLRVGGHSAGLVGWEGLVGISGSVPCVPLAAVWLRCEGCCLSGLACLSQLPALSIPQFGKRPVEPWPPQPALGSRSPLSIPGQHLVSTACAHSGPSCLGKPGVAFPGIAWKRVRACRRDSVPPACSGGGVLNERVSEQKPAGQPAGPVPCVSQAGRVSPATFPCPASETQGPAVSPAMSS